MHVHKINFFVKSGFEVRPFY